VAKLFARAIRNTHENRSISALFVKKEETNTLFNP